MSSATDESTPANLADRPLRRAVPGTVAAAAWCALAGLWTLTGTAATYAPALLVPSAVGLPFAVPALRLTPLGATTVDFWIVELVAAAVLLVVVARRLRRPVASRASAFGTGVIAMITGLLAANLLRSVHLSAVTHVELGGYVVVVLGGAVVAVLWGALLGTVVGFVHALSALPGGRPTRIERIEASGRSADRPHHASS